MGSGFDLGFRGAQEAFQNSQQINEQNRLARQAKLSAIIGDSLNNLPLPKDANGNPDINNPVYKQIKAQRAELFNKLLDEYTPTQHANIIQHVGGLLLGKKNHAIEHPNQPLPAYGTGPHAQAAQAAGEQAAQAQQDLQQGQIPLQPMETVPVQTNPFTPAPAGHPLHKITEALAGLKNHLAAFAHPDIPKPDNSQLVNALASSYADPQQLAHERLMESIGSKGEYALKVQQLRNEAIKASLAGRRPALLSESTIPEFLAKVKADPSMAEDMVDSKGNPLSLAQLSEMPQDMAVREMRAGNNVFFAVGNKGSKTGTFGGIVYNIPALGTITPENSTPLGTATGALPVKTGQTETAPGGGQVLKGTTEREKETPGMAGAGVPPAAPVPPPAAVSPTAPATTPPTPTLHQRPAVTPPAVTPSALQKTKPQVGTASVGDVAPNIQKMTQANALKATKAQPSVTALLGIYGDPQLPQVKSMMDFSDLAGDPHAQKVLGEAFKLLNQQMGEISDPGILQTLGTSMGWANFRANAEAQAQQDVGTRMTDREKEYFNAAISTMADIIGARAATGQGPAKFSVQMMENEVPQIGTSSVTDQRSYIQKMLTIARQVKVGLNAMPDNSRALKWLLQRENELIKQGNALSPKLNPRSANAPSIPPKRPANVPDGWIFRENGPKGKGWYAPTAAK